jgi:hypothetical protein
MATADTSVRERSHGPGFDPSELPPSAPKRHKFAKAEEPKKKPASTKQDNADLGSNVDDAEFWEWLGAFSGDQWQNLIMYLWRIEPITDRRTGGKPTHIQKYSYRIDIDTVMQEWGSGIYRLDVCQVNPATGGSKRIRQHFFSINNPNHPPKIPVGDWIDEPSNAMWKPFKQKMLEAEAERNGEVLAKQQQQTGTSAADANALFQTIFTAVKGLGNGEDSHGLASQLLAMLTATQAQMFAMSDPKKQMEFVDQMLRQRNPSGPDPMLTFLQAELRDSRKDLRDAIAKLDEMRSELLKPRDVLEDIERIGGAMEKFGSLLGYKKVGSKTDSGNGVVALVDKVVDKLTDQLPVIFNYLEQRERTVAAGNRTSNPNQWPGTPPAAGPLPAADALPAAAAPGSVAPEAIEQEKRRLEELGQRFAHLLGPAAPFMVDHFTRQLTGYDLRDWFREAHGAVNWAAFKREVGAERLTAMVVMHPQLTSIMQPPEEVLGFFREFFTEPGQEELETEESVPPLGDGDNTPHG